MGVLRRDGMQTDVDARFGYKLFANVVGFHISFSERDIEIDFIGKSRAGNFHVEIIDGVDLFENIEETGGIERRSFYFEHLCFTCENRAEARRMATAWAWFGNDETQIACAEADERHALNLQWCDDDFADFARRQRISLVINDFHQSKIRWRMSASPFFAFHETRDHFGRSIGGIDATRPEVFKLLCKRCTLHLLGIQWFTDAEDVFDGGQVNGVVRQKLAEFGKKRRNADDGCHFVVLDDVRMAFQRVEAVADNGAAEQNDASRIGETRDETTVERAGDEGGVFCVHTGGFEADGVVVTKAMDVIKGIDDFAWTARRAAGEDDIGNVALRNGDEIFVTFMDIMFGSQRKIFQIVKRERTVGQMGKLFAIER